jgi:hypothetical protein
MKDTSKIVVNIFLRAAIALLLLACSSLLSDYLVEKLPALQKPLHLLLVIIFGIGGGVYIFQPAFPKKNLKDE